jgi:hypothetical protein
MSKTGAGKACGLLQGLLIDININTMPDFHATASLFTLTSGTKSYYHINIFLVFISSLSK